jgi:hypothetical protein
VIEANGSSQNGSATGMLDAALWYAQSFNWRVVQAHHITPNGFCSCGKRDSEHTRRQGGKHPIVKAWPETATSDPNTIRALWRARPNANVLLKTGPESGVFALDIDPENGGHEGLALLTAEHGALPKTFRTHTGSGGDHYLFAYPADFDINNSTKALRGIGVNGIDVRGEGGCLVLAPSVSGKGPYSCTQAPVAEAPAWLLDILRPAKHEPDPTPQVATAPPRDLDHLDQYTRKALDDECDAITYARDGDQNNAINVAAFNVGTLVGAGALSEHEARDALLDACRAGNHPEGRARPTVESGLRAGISQPRHPWPPLSSHTTTPASTGAQVKDRETFGDRVKRGVYPDEQAAAEHFNEEPDPLGGVEMPRPPGMDAATMLPAVIRDMALAVADHLQVPVEAPALMGLATLSTAAIGRTWVRDDRMSWTEPLVLRTLTTMKSGERKSATLKIVASPIAAYERALWDAHDRNIEASSLEHERLTLQIEDCRKELKKNTSDPARLADLESLLAQQAVLPTINTPPPQLTIIDSTPEALIVALRNNDECIGMLMAEDSLFAQVGGQYSKGPANISIYLSSYDEESYTVNRVERGVSRLRHPALAMGLLVQPHVLDRAAQIPGARDSGLMGRWIYGAPESTLGDRSVDTDPPSSAALIAWDRVVNSVLALPRRPDDRPIIHLSHEAHLELRELRSRLEPHQREVVGRYAHMTDWTGKLAGTTMRVAGLYHLAQGHRHDTSVNLQTMRMATALARWATAQAEYIHRSWRDTPTPEGVEHVVKWIRARKLRSFTRRELARAVQNAKWYSPLALDDALAELHTSRWIASIAETDANGRSKAAGRYLAHPSLLPGDSHD